MSTQQNYISTVTDLGDLRREIDIFCDEKGVEKAIRDASIYIGKGATLKGFRKGKAPWKLIRGQFRDEVKTQASSILSQAGFLSACYENKIQPLTAPNVKLVEMKDGKFHCIVEVDIKPQISLTGYVGIELTEPEYNLDNEMEKILTSLYEEHADIEDREIVDYGNVVVCNYKATVGDELISEQENVPAEIQQNSEPPFGENLCGMKIGETKTFEIILSEEFKNHVGDTSEVEITIKNIFEKVPLSNTDALIKKLEYDSIDQLKAMLKDKAEKKKQSYIRSFYEEKIIEKLLSFHEFEVPPKWIEDEYKYILKNTGYSGDDENTLSEMKRTAQDSVKRTFILDAIYEAEPVLKVTKEEFDEVLKTEGNRLGKNLEDFRKEIEEAGMVDEIFSSIKTKKIMNFLLEQADIQKTDEREKDNE